MPQALGAGRLKILERFARVQAQQMQPFVAVVPEALDRFFEKLNDDVIRSV